MSEESPEREEFINVDEEVKNSFLDYSMSVIISRALPDARDGLKPSQRRLLYAMANDLSLSPGKAHLKCARIVGETMGKYHPHGDGAIYPTLVNMAQDWSMRDTLVEGQGNFGSVEGDPPAAMRYTEARLTHLGVSLMTDMDKATVDFVPNYDETRKEPAVLPAAFPNLLVNGGTGIAVGMATNIAPHNLGEVIDGIIAQIDNPDISIDGLMEFIKGPDFPTGCTILGTRGIRDYLFTGRGPVRVRGRAEVVEDRNREQIIITEIPYNVNRATLVERIAELVNTKVITDISAIRDESDENTRVAIDLKRDARAQVVLNNLYKHTQLETTFSSNMLAIDDRRPRLLNLKDAINCYIEHRREVILRRTRYLLEKAELEAEKLEAYLTAIGDLDEVIKIVRGSMTRDEAFTKLKEKKYAVSEAEAYGIHLRGQHSVDGTVYRLTDNQVNHILELRLYQLTGLERDKIKGAYEKILEEIVDYLDILEREERVLGIIKDELGEIREKYATPRRTDIQPWDGDMDIIDLIANEGNVITISKRGFIKRTLSAEYRTQNRGGKGLKGMETREAVDENDEADFVEHLFSAGAHDYLMFFTNTGRVYVHRAYAIPEGGRTAKGRSIRNMLNLKPEESIASVLRLEGTKDEKGNDTTFLSDTCLLFATRDGTVKKTKLIDYKNHRKDGIIAIRIDEGNELVNVRLTSGSDDICLLTRNGLCVRTKEENIRTVGRPSRGVRGIRPRGDDYVVALAVADDDAQFLIVSERGIGKRSPFTDFPTKGRGGKGVIAMKITDRTGKVAGATVITDEDEVMFMTSTGQSVRVPAASISLLSRSAQGVKIMELREGETIQDLAKVVQFEGDGDGEVSDAAAAAASDGAEHGAVDVEPGEAADQPQE
jgi:DNA gyrase subunit A